MALNKSRDQPLVASCQNKALECVVMPLYVLDVVDMERDCNTMRTRALAGYTKVVLTPFLDLEAVSPYIGTTQMQHVIGQFFLFRCQMLD